MAAPDVVTWNENLPDNSTLAHLIDDFNRDLRSGVRARMAREHIWPASQTATNEAGHHQYISFQSVSSASIAAIMVGTTAGAIYVGSSGAGYPLVYVNSAGTGYTVVGSAGGIAALVSGGTQGSIPICSSANPNSLIALTGSVDGYYLTSHSSTGAPTWTAFDITAHVAIETGTIADGGTIALPAGYTAGQCKWFVSVYDADWRGAEHWYNYTLRCSVDANRLVVCRIGGGYNEAYPANSRAGTANYVIIGIK